MLLNIGDVIRHNKRGSEYEVMGIWEDTPWDWNDGQDYYLSGWDVGETFWHLCSEQRGDEAFSLKVRLQISTPSVQPFVKVIIYRALEPKRGEPWLFARPLHEFTEDRFTKVST